MGSPIWDFEMSVECPGRVDQGRMAGAGAGAGGRAGSKHGAGLELELEVEMLEP